MATETQEVLDMLGKGYDDHPSVEISPAHVIIERRNGRMQEIEHAAFVKISTEFKRELHDIDGDTLKVWLYLALSVNRLSGKACPGLRRIAKDVNLAVNTVRAAIDKLENKYCLVLVEKEPKRLNKYEPVAYVSANHKQLSVSQDDTDLGGKTKTVSKRRKTVSKRRKTVSTHVDTKPEKPDQPDIDLHSIIEKSNKEVDFILKQAGLSAGKSWTLLPEIYHPYGKAFCAGTGIVYAKRDFGKWSIAFETWQEKGHTPQAALDAIQALKDEGKSGTISGPSSITWKMDAMVTERTTRQQKQEQRQQEPISQIPEEWLKYYENVPTA